MDKALDTIDSGGRQRRCTAQHGIADGVEDRAGMGAATQEAYGGQNDELQRAQDGPDIGRWLGRRYDVAPRPWRLGQSLWRPADQKGGGNDEDRCRKSRDHNSVAPAKILDQHSGQWGYGHWRNAGTTDAFRITERAPRRSVLVPQKKPVMPMTMKPTVMAPEMPARF